MKTIHLKIEGMTCGGCARSIERALKKNGQVVSAKIDVRSGMAELETDLDPTTVAAVVEALGYDVYPVAVAG